MRNLYLVSYDVCNPKRLSVMYRTMLGFGDAMHYSVFICELSLKEKALLEDAIVDVIKHDEDRVLMANLGPAGGRGEDSLEFFGLPPEPRKRQAHII